MLMLQTAHQMRMLRNLEKVSENVDESRGD